MKKGLTILLAALFMFSSAGMVLAGDKIDLETTELTDIDGKMIKAKDFFGGKKTVIAFAQTACANCREEISFLVGAAKDNPDLQYAVAIVDLRSTPARINSYLGELKWEGKVLTDPRFQLARAMGVNQTPALIIVDGEGNKTFMTAGYDDEIKSSISAAISGGK